MSNLKAKYDNLPKLQHRIILCLAKHEPMNVREANRELKGEYTSTNRAFKELLKKGYIQQINVKIYRGRQFAKFWLSSRGLIYAITHEANPHSLTENIYGKQSIETLLVRLASVLGAKAFRFVNGLMREEGLTENTLSIVLSTALLNAKMFTNKKPEVLTREIVTVLKDYPEFYGFYKKIYQCIKRGIINVSEIIEEGVSHE